MNSPHSKRFSIVCALLLMVVFLVYLHVQRNKFTDRVFDAMEWRQADVSERGEMAHSLVESRQLNSLNERSVLELLGLADNKSQNPLIWYYKVGELRTRGTLFTDKYSLAVYFKDGLVDKVLIIEYPFLYTKSDDNNIRRQ